MKNLLKLCLLFIGIIIANLSYAQSELTQKTNILFDTYQEEGFGKMIVQYD